MIDIHANEHNIYGTKKDFDPEKQKQASLNNWKNEGTSIYAVQLFPFIIS